MSFLLANYLFICKHHEAYHHLPIHLSMILKPSHLPSIPIFLRKFFLIPFLVSFISVSFSCFYFLKKRSRNKHKSLHQFIELVLLSSPNHRIRISFTSLYLLLFLLFPRTTMIFFGFFLISNNNFKDFLALDCGFKLRN